MVRAKNDYPSTVPIDSTLPFPFVSVLTRSVSVLKALGLICTICTISDIHRQNR